MGGFITERDFGEAEVEFPGIQRFYDGLGEKPRTFLELVWRYEATRDTGVDATTLQAEPIAR